MEWNQLICTVKYKGEDTSAAETWGKYSLSPFEKDYRRVITSSAFRRLQDKTQVFPLDKSDFVRTRLTHSLEVSMIAKRLGLMLYEGKWDAQMPEGQKDRICDILSCAGLLHDLGNPPFGHFGETIIGEWFSDFLGPASEDPLEPFKGNTYGLTDQMCKDLARFEGNAQSVRLLLRNAYSRSDLNLTYTAIHTLLKYPTSSRDRDKHDLDAKRHKSGYFLAEEEHIQEIARTLGTMDGEGNMARHPLTYILEAADDIAYVTADLEDAFKKDLFTLEQFADFYDQALGEKRLPAESQNYKKSQALIRTLHAEIKQGTRNKENEYAAMKKWVNEAREWLMYVAAHRFSFNYKDIMEGKFKNDLFYDTFHDCSVQILKQAMNRFVFHSRGIAKQELSAQTVLRFLLDRFVPAVIKYENPTATEQKYIDLLSGSCKVDYEAQAAGSVDPVYKLYLRFLMVTDFVSGMTDSYAMNLYRELSGIVQL